MYVSSSFFSVIMTDRMSYVNSNTYFHFQPTLDIRDPLYTNCLFH